MNTTEVRPEHVTDEVLEYLDELRESGATNMFGAAPYLEAAFDFGRAEAQSALKYWMHTFGERHPAALSIARKAQGVENKHTKKDRFDPRDVAILGGDPSL